MKLSGKRVTVEFTRYPRSLLCEIWTRSGFCFDDGTHVRVIEFHSGTKRQLRAAMVEFVETDAIVECDDPECDICHPVELECKVANLIAGNERKSTK